MTTYRSIKINTGIYEVKFSNGASIRLERDEYGLWNTFDQHSSSLGNEEYMQTYRTKADAIAELVACADELVNM